MERNVTIKEVARQAGVGIATVSRVLNNSDRVDPDTRARVLEVIRALGYRPNAQGRRLVKRATEMVCFVLSNRDFMNPFHAGILNGAERYMSQTGHELIFTNLHLPPDLLPGQLVLPRILSHRGIADGVILSGTVYPNLLAAVEQLGIASVLFGNNLFVNDGAEDRTREFDTVYFEERASSRAAAEMLVRLGHRDIWFVGDTRKPWFRHRAEACRAVMREQGLEYQEYSVPWEIDARDYGVGYGEQAMLHMLAQEPRPTAALAGNDGIAFGMWRTLHRQGLQMPADISIVGFDDVQEARLTEPPLTTVRVPTDEIGRACAEMLVRKLADGGRPQPARLIATELVERGSCGPPRARPAIAAHRSS